MLGCRTARRRPCSHSRVAGVGSLGRLRYASASPNAMAAWPRARRRRGCLPPRGWAEWRGRRTMPLRCACSKRAVRQRDPFYLVRDGWVVRRLGPHCGRNRAFPIPAASRREGDPQGHGARRPPTCIWPPRISAPGAARSRQAEARLAAPSSAGHGRSDRAGLEEFPVGRRRGLAPGAAKLAKHAVEAHRHRSSPCSGRGSHLHRIDCGWRDGSRLLASSRPSRLEPAWFDPRFAYRSFKQQQGETTMRTNRITSPARSPRPTVFAMPHRRPAPPATSGEANAVSVTKSLPSRQ